MLTSFEVINIIHQGRRIPKRGVKLNGNRTYVAGPMTGYELWNFPAFDAARDELLEAGDIVYSPADLDRARGFHEWMTEFPADSYTVAMQIDLTVIAAYATRIYLMKGWSDSKGAKIEFSTALATGKEIAYATDAERAEVLV